MIYVLGQKAQKLLIISVICVLVSFSIGYAALNQGLNISGEVTILPSAAGTIVNAISSGTFTNNASESSNSSINGSTATVSVSLSRVNSQASYDITIKNTGTVSSRFSSLDVTISNSAMTYSISGIDTSTILASGEEVTCTITIYYADDYKYELPSSTTSSLVFDFQFISTTREALKKLTGTISPTSGDVTQTDHGALFSITLNNPNDFPISYTLEGENDFVVYNENKEIATYYLAANASDTFNIYIDDSDTSIAENTTATVNIIAKVSDYDEFVSSTIGSVELTLEDKGKYIVLAGGGGIKATPDDIDYSAADSSSSGIYAAEDSNGGTTYYYRGTVSNNYFSFAGYTWRIIRIDNNSNIRLILNGFIANSSGSVVTKQFKTSNTATSKESSDTLLKMVNDINDSSVNSPVYGSIDSTDTTTLRGWYNTNLTSYESYIVNSQFCFDTSGGHTTSSGTYTSVFYYGSYQRIGVDAGLYSPDFVCASSDQFEEKIGLLSADEYVFAGGAFRVSNTLMFLNDFGSSYGWWTLSPAYYDSNLSTVGLFMVPTNGAITDWPNGNTITNSYALRPVITVNGNLEITGSGTSSDPYHF